MAIAPSDNNNSTATPGASTSHNQQQITSSENNNNNNNNKKLVNEMVGGCSVCSDDQGTEENPLVYCDGCEVAVHQACYGIVNVPSGSWFCRKCESGDGQLKIKCELCPSKEGALKRTETGDWAHVVCALYIPEVRFGNNNTMEPIEIKHIHADRYAKSCYLCLKAGNLATVNYGAVMNCHKLGCKQSFHVTCAQTAGLLCEEAGQGSDNVIYCGYCKHHFRKLKEVAGGSRKTGNKSSSYNSASSYSDSASDSSQDNETRCNTTTDYDKTNQKTNNNNKQNILPTNLSISDGLANDFNTTTTISSQQNTANTSKLSGSTPNNGPISLTIPSNNNSNKNITSPSSSSTSSAKDGTTKRKRAPKINSSNTLDNSSGSIAVITATNTPSSTLPTTGILSNPQTSQHSINPSQSSNIISKPISNHNNNSYDMGSSQQQSDAKTNEKSPVTASNKNNKNVNKKTKTSTSTTPTSTTISSSTQGKQQQSTLSTNTQPISATNYKDLNKISSPNLSLSTSPSLASPSNSAKSNSSTSSITTTTASSCSSTSNSPSPALLSPNITNNQRGAAVRIESPLASKSKTGINSSSSGYKTLPESVIGNVASSSTESPSPVSNNNLKGTRTNIQHKNDSKKNNPIGSSSLLSTAMPLSQDLLISQSNPHPSIDFSSLVAENILQSAGSSKDSSTLLKNKQNPIQNTLPIVPPLIIPVQQLSTNNNEPKTTAKTSKTGAKGAGSRKKSTETSENPKPEPKVKSSRTTKKNALAAAAAATPASSTNTASPSKSSTETPKRGKGRAAAAKQSNNLAPEQTTNNTPNKRQSPSTSPGKRKSRSTSNESTSSPAPTPAKRQRKKKTDPQLVNSLQTNEPLSSINSIKPPPSLAPLNSQFLTSRPPSSSSGAILGPIGGGPLMVNTPIPNSRLLGQGFNTAENHDIGLGSGGNKYFSPMISPYANYDNLSSVPSLSRASLSRLFTTSSADINTTNTNNNSINLQDDPAKAFDELRDNTWSHLSKCVLEQAQQFDIPSLIGTLYTLRSENDKLVNRVRELTMKRNELIAINARLDLTGPMLTQHLNNTSPNFSSVVSGLTNSPKSLPASSPGSAIGSKQQPPPPPNPLASYNHLQPGNTLGQPGFLDSNSPMVSQSHSGMNNIKTSSISTPSPPISALMAHSNSNRAGLITINPPYMPNVFPPMSTLAQLGTTPQSSSYYSRQ